MGRFKELQDDDEQPDGGPTGVTCRRHCSPRRSCVLGGCGVPRHGTLLQPAGRPDPSPASAIDAVSTGSRFRWERWAWRCPANVEVVHPVALPDPSGLQESWCAAGTGVVASDVFAGRGVGPVLREGRERRLRKAARAGPPRPDQACWLARCAFRSVGLNWFRGSPAAAAGRWPRLRQTGSGLDPRPSRPSRRPAPPGPSWWWPSGLRRRAPYGRLEALTELVTAKLAVAVAAAVAVSAGVGKRIADLLNFSINLETTESTSDTATTTGGTSTTVTGVVKVPTGGLDIAVEFLPELPCRAGEPDRTGRPGRRSDAVLPRA